MKIQDLNKRMTAGEPILTGKFLSCTIEKSQSGTEYEQTVIVGTRRNVELKRWAKKGSPAGSLKLLHSAIPVGAPVALLGYGADVRDGYLQHDCKEVVTIEG